jgi:hypothetical protein
MENLSSALSRRSFGAFALIGALAAAGPALGQTSPFSVEDNNPVCEDTAGGGSVCVYEMGSVPANRRWQVQMVACRNNLLSTTATEIATLSIVRTNGSNLFSFPIIPVKVTSNAFTISQLISVPVPAKRAVRVSIQSFGAKVVFGSFCTLSGDEVTLP